MKINKIIVLANKYPNIIEKNVNVFTQQITWSFADQGVQCIVICPKPVFYDKGKERLPTYIKEVTDTNKKIEIYRPVYVSAGQSGRIIQKQRVMFTTWNYIRAVNKVLSKIDLSGAVLFAEFLCPTAVAAAQLGLKYNIPAFMQCGEATYQGDEKYGNVKLQKLLKGLTGAVALSGQNKGFLVDNGLISKNRVIILPSGYRKDRFYVRDSVEARKKLGLPLDKFLVGFCGSFDDRKGIKRLEASINKTNDIYLVAVGKGAKEYQPTSNKCIFCQTVNHDELAWFYNAVDVYAMPTYHEGSCTAIVEAIACGKPIVSSDRPFNYEICDETNSILLDPDDVDGFAKAFVDLKNNPGRLKVLSNGSVEMSKHLSLNIKAEKVIEFMESIASS